MTTFNDGKDDYFTPPETSNSTILSTEQSSNDPKLSDRMVLKDEANLTADVDNKVVEGHSQDESKRTVLNPFSE